MEDDKPYWNSGGSETNLQPIGASGGTGRTRHSRGRELSGLCPYRCWAWYVGTGGGAALPFWSTCTMSIYPWVTFFKRRLRYIMVCHGIYCNIVIYHSHSRCFNPWRWWLLQWFLFFSWLGLCETDNDTVRFVNFVILVICSAIFQSHPADTQL